jgi:sporulation protein YabP
MDRMSEVPAFTHVIKLNDRKNIIISGIKKINSFDEKEFDLDSIMGNIIIKGENLEMIKLDTIEGNVSIKGKINSFMYSDIQSKESSILTKLFK